LNNEFVFVFKPFGGNVSRTTYSSSINSVVLEHAQKLASGAPETYGFLSVSEFFINV